MMKKHFNSPKTSRQNILLLAIVVFLLAISIWQFLLLPQEKTIKLMQEEYAEKVRQREQIASFFRKHPEYDEYTLKLDEKWETAQIMLPEQIEVSEFLLETDKIAKATGVSIIDIKPLPKIQREGYVEVPFEIIAQGNFEAMLNFSQSLENFERFIAINSAAISLLNAQDTEKSVPELESKISIVIYSSN